MQPIHTIRKARADSRAGMTLTEVMLGLAVFLIGSVSIVGLFVSASVLHAEGANRRTASFIAEELRSAALSMRLREVFAKTELEGLLTQAATLINVLAVEPAVDHPIATFDEVPVVDTFFPLRADQDFGREEGPLLIGTEWIWYGSLGATSFTDCARDLWGTSNTGHSNEDDVLQPRTWFYVFESLQAFDDDGDGDDDRVVISTRGDPTSFPEAGAGGLPGAPLSGYIVIDNEWMRYTQVGSTGTQGTFTVEDTNRDDAPDRGWGDSKATPHKAGTPVTVAREHSFYPGFYYTVQYYPVNPNGLEARVIVSVGYRTGNMFRTWFFRSSYTAASY